MDSDDVKWEYQGGCLSFWRETRMRPEAARDRAEVSETVRRQKIAEVTERFLNQ